MVEESTSSFFCLERPRSFLGRLLGTPTRFSLSVDDFEKWTKVRLVSWPGGQADSKSMWAMWQVLNSRPVPSPAPDPGDDGVSRQAPVDVYRALNIRPAWFKWAKYGQVAYCVVLLLAYSVLLALDFSYAALPIAVPLIWVAFLSYPLVFDLAPRHFLKISSKRGLGASLAYWCACAVVLTAMLVLFAFLES